MASKELSILLTAKDMASKTIGQVSRQLGGLGKTGNIVGAGLRTMGSNLARMGTALLASAGIAGIFSITGAFEQAITKVRDFGETVDKTMSLTGLSVEKASALSSALSYVGVNGDAVIKMLGMAEKNLGALTLTSKKAADFQKVYGMSLTDSNGTTIDANELLLRSADLYTSKTIPASQKAITLSKIYGRAWQSNIEIFEMGRQKIVTAEAEMAAAGVTMTAQNMKDWEKFRDATRSAGGALSGLELQLGLLVMPDITSGLKAFTEWTRTHQGDIKKFFADGLAAAKGLGDFIANTVIPALSTITGVASKIWGAIPAPMQQLLAGGFVLNKLSGGMVMKLAGNLFERGGTPANPLFVADVTGGIGKGLPGGALGGAVGNGGAMLAGGAAIAGAALSAGAVAAVGYVALDQYQQVRDQAKAIAAQAAEFVKTATLADIKTGREAVITGIKQLADQAWNPMTGAATEDLGRAYKTLTDAMNAKAAEVAHPSSGASMPVNAATGFSTPARQLSAQIRAALQSRVPGALAGGVGRADALVSVFQNSTAPSLKSMTSAMLQLRDLQSRYAAQGDTKLAASIRTDIALLRTAIDRTTAAVQGIPIINAQTGFTTGKTAVTVRDVTTATNTGAHYGPNGRKIE